MGEFPPVAVEHAPNGSQRSPPVMNMVLQESFMSWPRRAKGDESIREAIAEHREPALRLGFRRFVLKHIPMLGELPVFEADDVGSDPGRLPRQLARECSQRAASSVLRRADRFR